MFALARPDFATRNRRVATLFACFALTFALAPACATPTALTLSIYSELACDKGSVVALVGGGALDALPSKAPSAVSTTCDAAGRRGSVVVLPTTSKDESVSFAVMQRADGQPADGCLDPMQSSGCIVAKRQLRFAKHNASEMRIDLRLSCLGITCNTNETCVKGVCVDALTTCAASCDEAALQKEVSDAGDPTIPDAGFPQAADSGVNVPDSGGVAPGETDTCVAGKCAQTCAPGTTCSRDCAGGECQQTCPTGATCDFACTGGNCIQNCRPDASCRMSCKGSVDGSGFVFNSVCRLALAHSLAPVRALKT